MNEEAETSKAITGVASVKQFLAAKDDAGAAAVGAEFEAAAISAMSSSNASLLQVLAPASAPRKRFGGREQALSPANWRVVDAAAGELAALLELLLVPDRRGAPRRREARAQAHRSHVTKIHESQKRIRENIKAMEKMPTSSLVQRYMDDLNKEEDDLIATREATEKLEGEEMVEIERELASVRATLEEQADGLRSATINQAAGSV